jgi:hypothetical protein
MKPRAITLIAALVILGIVGTAGARLLYRHPPAQPLEQAITRVQPWLVTSPELASLAPSLSSVRFGANITAVYFSPSYGITDAYVAGRSLYIVFITGSPNSNAVLYNVGILDHGTLKPVELAYPGADYDSIGIFANGIISAGRVDVNGSEFYRIDGSQALRVSFQQAFANVPDFGFASHLSDGDKCVASETPGIAIDAVNANGVHRHLVSTQALIAATHGLFHQPIGFRCQAFAGLDFVTLGSAEHTIFRLQGGNLKMVAAGRIEASNRYRMLVDSNDGTAYLDAEYNGP